MNAYGVNIESLFVKTLKDVLHEAGISLTELNQPTRRRDLCEQRQAIMAYAATHHGYVYADAGLIFNKDHATVSHSKKQIKTEMELLDKYPYLPMSVRLQLYKKLIAIKAKK